jgi:bifunctional enzyme CysN/CysC
MSLIKETLKAEVSQREFMNIVIVGHVDHGKSTVIGRLLADTDSLPEGKLEQVRENCRRNSKPFEYAFLLDALKDERSQGITIDAARCFFKSKKRNYLILDAPGHVEFLKNMVTGASNAEAALLVIDAKEGIMENSTRHGYLLSMLGIRQIAVLVNKMDLVDYDRSVYEDIKKNYSDFLEKIGIKASCFIPVSGFQGDNITERSENMPWYDGDTVLERLDLFETAGLPIDMPFRMPVQGVYKFTQDGDDRRIVAGTVETGKLKVGDTVIFYPSGKKSKVKTIEAFNAPAPEICIRAVRYGRRRDYFGQSCLGKR